jgi:hypothetical protein
MGFEAGLHCHGQTGFSVAYDPLKGDSPLAYPDC